MIYKVHERFLRSRNLYKSIPKLMLNMYVLRFLDVIKRCLSHNIVLIRPWNKLVISIITSSCKFGKKCLNNQQV